MTAVVAGGNRSCDGARTMAIVHRAMFNAVNAIEPRFRSYGAGVDAPAGASADAAAAAAAHAVLVKLVPDQRDTLDGWPGRTTQQRLSGERGADAGIAPGERAAADCLALRVKDGSALPTCTGR